MADTVDTGEIIGVNRFPTEKGETVESLSLKTYSSMLTLYKETITHIVDTGELPKSNKIWKRKPYKRSELEELATIDTEMDKKEVDKRIRATYYPGQPAPFIELAGYRFEYNPKR
jgi:methionyl-tRNA formyltransferase